MNDDVVVRARTLLQNRGTQGPWFVERHYVMDEYRSRIIVIYGESEQDDADAAFIAACPVLVEELCDELERWKASHDELATAGDRLFVENAKKDEEIAQLREGKGLQADGWGDLRKFVVAHPDMPDGTRVLAPMGWLRALGDLDRVVRERDEKDHEIARLRGLMLVREERR